MIYNFFPSSLPPAEPGELEEDLGWRRDTYRRRFCPLFLLIHHRPPQEELLTNSRLRHRGLCFPKTHLEENKRKGKCRRNIFFSFSEAAEDYNCHGKEPLTFHGVEEEETPHHVHSHSHPLFYTTTEKKEGNFPFSFREKLFLLFLSPPPLSWEWETRRWRREGDSPRDRSKEKDLKRRRKEAPTPFPLFFQTFFISGELSNWFLSLVHLGNTRIR